MAETQTQYKPLIFNELSPCMNITVIHDKAGLQKLKEYFERKKAEASLLGAVPYFGFDTETSMTVDFWFRRVRTMQFGDKNEQYVVDLFSLAGSKDRLIETQGHYGVNNGDVYAELKSIIEPVLCSKDFLKVGQNLAFEYEVMNWNFGLRIWNLYSVDLAERVIQAGTLSLKQYSNFSMVEIFKRYFKFEIDKTQQSQFNLEAPLTQAQIEYAAFDIRAPISIWQAQVRILNRDQLATTTQIENDALGSYTDMHLNGQNLNDEKWIARIEATKLRRTEELKILDEGFLPIVGHKLHQIDEDELHRLEMIWKTEFEEATPLEKEVAASARLEKDKEKKTALRTQLKNLQQQRRGEKQIAHKAFLEKSKLRTKWANEVPKCEGEAYINYASPQQLVEALQQVSGMRAIDSASDDVLLKYNDRPLIQTLRKYRKGKKSTGTYGMQWVTRWVTKPCKEEGWRHPGDGRLHCRFNQLEAETGRSSSSKPNGQNLPIEEEVRDCFICDPPDINEPDGYCIVTVDMQGCELRIIADEANATTWITAFAKGWDVHSVSTEILEREKWYAGTEVGCLYFDKNETGELKRQKCECSAHKKLRKKTKAINFLLCYGGGPDALADELDITIDEAKELMAQHEKAFPDVWNFLYRSGEEAKRDKESRDMFGRRRSFPTPTYELAEAWILDDTDRYEKLKLPEDKCAANIAGFKRAELREPNKEELRKLTHRNPNHQEIKWAMRSMLGSISRRGKNHRIQGTNASIIKRAMGCGFDAHGKPYLWHTLPQFKAKLLSMVHDELIIQCPIRFGEQVKALVGDAFRRAAAEVMKKVVMEFDGHIADRWVKE
jgi:DNA polymerase I-like protein with 3'-5' exonuclease and polymerase domains